MVTPQDIIKRLKTYNYMLIVQCESTTEDVSVE